MNFFNRTPWTMKKLLTRSIRPIVHAEAALCRTLLAFVYGIILAMALPAVHAAGPPEFMAYQGFLVDANGNPLAPSSPANYPVIFRMFATPTGGSSLWSEQQIVTVDKGNFSVILGEGTSIGEAKPALSTVVSTNGADRYIELAVVIGNPPAVPMLPRLRLLPIAYAFLATSANNLVSPAGVPVIRYANNRVELNGDVSYSGGISGNGSGLSGLTAAQIGSGTFADARLSPNVALRAGGNTFTGNQTISGSVGIGGAPVDSVLDVEGDIHLNLRDLFLREGADRNHGLGWFGTAGANKPFAGVNVDGPVLYGFSGGALATKSGGDRVALKWDNTGKVGIGNSAPSRLLDVGSSSTPNSEGMIRLASRSGTGGANRIWDMGIPETDDVITGSGYSFVIDDVQNGTAPELIVKWGTGDVGIGTTEPTAKLEVNGSFKAGSVTANSLTANTLTVNGAVNATTFNGEKAPATYTVGPGSNLNSWRELLIDTSALLGDANGGRIKVLLRNHSSREVRMVSYEFYAENDANNFGQALRYGTTVSSYAVERNFRLGSGTNNDRYDIASRFDWFWIRNYRSGLAFGGVDTVAENAGNRYRFWILVPPNITATVVVYDR
jgi:hypothetical protein